jgi:uncharacterized protein YqjF (DUF2071 family)
MERWLVAQTWEHLLFAHWRADPDALQRLLPRGVELDLRDGEAWLGVVPFTMTGTRALGLRLGTMAELNVRTYVRVGSDLGVWFLSLDCSSPLAVATGRSVYGLRYRLARMATAETAGRIHYVSSRPDGAFAGSFAPLGAVHTAEPGSLEHFLVERYRLYALRRGRLVSARVQHDPWPLQPAAASLETNTVVPPAIALDGTPLLHYARRVDTRIGPPGPVFPRAAAPPSRAARAGP